MASNWKEALDAAIEQGSYQHSKLTIEVDKTSHPIKLCFLDYKGNNAGKACYRYRRDALQYLNSEYKF